MEIKKRREFDLYYIDDALEFIIQNKLNWEEISNYFEEELGAYISYYSYFNSYKDAEFARNYLEGLIVMNKLME